jgi:low affinity Fe/Cu permease
MAETKEQTRQRRRQHSVVEEKIPQTGVAHWFTRTSSAISALMGSPWAFIVAAGIVIAWAVTGPIFNYSTDWSLAINTITTVITFLMVFLIQNTQNRDARAIHLKLDELLRAVPGARKEFMEAEEEDLDEIEREKEIVDQADPAPPADKKADKNKEERRQNGHALSGNGKTKHPAA